MLKIYPLLRKSLPGFIVPKGVENIFVVQRKLPQPVADGSASTGVGAILRFFVCGASCSGSLTKLVSLFPSVVAVVELGALPPADIGVIGGVDSGRFNVLVLVAVTPGTVPIVGVGEFPITGAVGGT